MVFEEKKQYNARITKNIIILSAFFIGLFLLMLVSVFFGSSKINFLTVLKAFFGEGKDSTIRIVWKIRMPRILGAILAGGCLSLSGLLLQSSLRNDIASSSTLGINNAAALGANICIILFAGGYINTGNHVSSYGASANPYMVSLFAFIFAMASTLLLVLVFKFVSFSPASLILSGVAIGAVWNALTTLLQFYSSDVGLSAAIMWSFGDLGKATYQADLILLIALVISTVVFYLLSWKMNALESGENEAKSVGTKVEVIRLIAIALSSLLSALSVSFFGIIAFVGIIAPHIVKRTIGHDHRFSIIGSVLVGGLVLLLADTLSRTLGGGTAIPVGAITSIVGAPIFLLVIITRRRKA